MSKEWAVNVGKQPHLLPHSFHTLVIFILSTICPQKFSTSNIDDSWVWLGKIANVIITHAAQNDSTELFFAGVKFWLQQLYWQSDGFLLCLVHTVKLVTPKVSLCQETFTAWTKVQVPFILPALTHQFWVFLGQLFHVEFVHTLLA